MLARRQFEQGDSLSQRTFRLRQTRQLLGFGVREGRLPPLVDALALFSALGTESPTMARDSPQDGIWDMASGIPSGP